MTLEPGWLQLLTDLGAPTVVILALIYILFRISMRILDVLVDFAAAMNRLSAVIETATRQRDGTA